MKSAPAYITVEEGRRIVRENVKPGRVENVCVLDAIDRVLAQDLTSDIDVTPFDDSAMDGYAVRFADLEAASEDSPVSLACIAHLGAGSTLDGALQPGQTARIMTGAMIPLGADAVVQFEHVTHDGDGSTGDQIVFSAPIAVGQNIRRAGEEAKKGDVIMAAGEVIKAAGAGLLAACGNTVVPVYARPKVGLISIGSELVDATQTPEPGMIRNSNIWAMQALVAQAGGISEVYPAVSDDLEEIKSLYIKAVEECDLVVSTGGACLGDFDLTGDVLRDLGVMLFERCNVKPGKSQPFGLIEGKPVFVLSGNPAAALTGFELYVRLAMRIMEGHHDLDRPKVTAKLLNGMAKKRDPRMFLQRATLSKNDAGEYQVEMHSKQSSGLYSALQNCNCFAVVPEGTEPARTGDMVTCIITSAEEGLIL